MTAHNDPRFTSNATGYDVIQGAPMVLTEDDIMSFYRGGTFYGGMGSPEYVKLHDGRIVYLGVPLCEGCETKLDGHVCHDCRVVYVDPPVLTSVERVSPTQVVL